jgi:hypothetical protein
MRVLVIDRDFLESCGVMTRALYISSLRFLSDSDTLSLASAAFSEAAPGRSGFCDVARIDLHEQGPRGSRCVPVSTGILVMTPEALDFTSITCDSARSSVGLAASMMMSRRVTSAVCTVGACSFFATGCGGGKHHRPEDSSH